MSIQTQNVTPSQSFLKVLEGQGRLRFGETAVAKAETISTTKGEPRPRRLSGKPPDPEFLSPRESVLIAKLACNRGWSEPEFVSALVECFGIAGPDFIPVEKYDEVLQMIEGGNEPAEKRIVLKGMQCR